ncbi:hypothetical protein CTEN210_18101 [Chaetoceros tenuissimus]|uniref:Uncharacterized protein n=1 Tax=Chaetoceros tenuissimus TaxID=426638 RepID=A0AAD3HFE0_9STRA|nr:hypothetical protein CTEN210_18101 [Chaetoceros tenuissimus]
MHVTASALCLLATLSTFSLPNGTTAQEMICETFFGLDAASDALEWCGSPERTTKCCTDDAGNVSPNACGNWGSNAEYNLCEGSCQGTESCFSVLTNAAPGSSISIKEGGCVSESLRLPCCELGVCEGFAKEVNGVVTASIGKGSCSGGVAACHKFLGGVKASGDISIDILDGTCYGRSACEHAFGNAGSGSSIVIKEGGCVGLSSCQNFAENVDGVVTATIGKGSCSQNNACDRFLGFFAGGGITVDIQDQACKGVNACEYAFIDAEYLTSLTVPAGECSAENACASCVEDNESGGGLAVTTECCASNVDDACLYFDAPSNIPSMSSLPSSLPSSNPSESSKPSEVPSNIPSMSSLPSSLPSSNPSESSKPSEVPSNIPSMSSLPSSLPSSNPSESSKPSEVPSNIPSMSSLPSSLPSSNPSESSKPSEVPSNIPSMSSLPSSLPSSNPSESSKPSEVPSKNKNVKGGKANKAPKTEKASKIPKANKAPKTEKASKTPKKFKDQEQKTFPDIDIVDVEITAEGSFSK